MITHATSNQGDDLMFTGTLLGDFALGVAALILYFAFVRFLLAVVFWGTD